MTNTTKNNGRPRRDSMDKLSEAEKIQVIWRMKKVYYLSMLFLGFSGHIFYLFSILKMVLPINSIKHPFTN